MNRIRGKTAVVTGATAGIGEACALALAGRGARVIALGRRKDRLDALAVRLGEGRRSGWPGAANGRGTDCEGGQPARRNDATGEAGSGGDGSSNGSRTYVLDVRDRDRVATFGDWLAEEGIAPDVLVNNAGLARGLHSLHEGSAADWDEMIDTNVKGLLNVTRALLPGMVERDAGHVVNVGSIAGHLVYPKGNVYAATKFAVRALTDAANLDLVGTRVRMSSVDPGLVETEFSLVRFRGDAGRARQTYEHVDALQPEDVADAVCYVLNAPPRVNVQRMIVMPTVQRSPYVMAKRS